MTYWDLYWTRSVNSSTRTASIVRVHNPSKHSIWRGNVYVGVFQKGWWDKPVFFVCFQKGLFTIQRAAHIKFLFNFSETGKLQKRPFCFGNTQEACERASHECTILFVNGCVKLSVFPLSNTLHFLVQVSLSHKNRQQIPVHTIRINNKLPRG